MIDTFKFGSELKRLGFELFAGIPCSLLKSLINHAVNRGFYIRAANEGDAIAIAAGAYLGGKKGVVLMQNSGLANAISPLVSLNHIFRIPVLGFVSLRGEEGGRDEPQHELMGKITAKLLDDMGIAWEFLSTDTAQAGAQLEDAQDMIKDGKSFFFVVRKETFADEPLREGNIAKSHNCDVSVKEGADAYPPRQEALKGLVDIIGDNAAILTTTGYTSRELYEIKDAPNHFYMVGSMGCVSSIGLGLSLARPRKRVVVCDGDGALLMRLGALATNGYYAPSNMLHILFDNHCHSSTGGQRTVSENVDFIALAKACGYSRSRYAHTVADMVKFIREWSAEPKLTFLYLRVNAGAAGHLGRPKIKPHEATKRFMDYLKDD